MDKQNCKLGRKIVFLPPSNSQGHKSCCTSRESVMRVHFGVQHPLRSGGLFIMARNGMLLCRVLLNGSTTTQRDWTLHKAPLGEESTGMRSLQMRKHGKAISRKPHNTVLQLRRLWNTCTDGTMSSSSVLKTLGSSLNPMDYYSKDSIKMLIARNCHMHMHVSFARKPLALLQHGQSMRIDVMDE